MQLSALTGASLLAGCQNSAVKNSDKQTNATDKTDLPKITHRKVQTNGINMHIAEAGAGFPVLFLHGFAELWYSWRHQLPAIAAAGFHAVAPDLRGFGQTDTPPDIESYSTKNRAADVVGLLDALNADKCVLVGNDWGSGLGWAIAQLYPQRIAAMFHLNIAYAPRGDEPPLASIAKFASGHFNFALHFQEPGVAEKEFEKDVKASIRRFLYAFSGEAPPGVTEYLFLRKPANTDVLEGMPEPEKLPAWLTEADLDYYAKEYSRTGFRGPLNMYRNMDRDWKELPQVGTGEVKQPVLFMGGRRDPSVIFAPFDPMIKAVPELREIIFLKDCGHWVQQERAEAVNQELIEYLNREIRDIKEE
ncbi:MAG TPA: alpha/beta hydrolase [Blastocatellia bacterium]|nr:alpha/beta hydrolase [Blastocatellia bacterium]